MHRRLFFASSLARIGLAALVAAVAAGCAGGAARTVPPIAPALPGAATTGSARFTIAVPSRSAAGSVRRPRYVGPSTQSLRIAISGPSNSTQIVNLTPTSNGCASTLATTQCTLVLTLTPGSYTASLTTYDGADATGNLLSLAQSIHFTIVAGTANTIALALDGVPHRIVVTSSSPAVSGSAAAGFVLRGTLAQTLTAEAFDADGNVIVGPGSPTYTVALLSGSGFTTANPSAGTPNSFSVTPPGVDGAAAWVKVAATSSNNACNQVGASCSTAFLVRNHLQPLFVASLANAVAIFRAPYTGAPTTVSNGLSSGPNGLALDADGNLFVTDDIQLAEYAPPYTGSPTLFGNSVSVSVPIATGTDAAADLFVANDGHSTISIFAPPYTGTPTTVSNGISTPSGFAVDPAGDFFVSNSGGNVLEFKPPYTSLPAVISNGVSGPGALALDAAGTLFIANTGNNTVTYYPPAYNTSPIAVSTGISQPRALALDALGNLFVANGNNTVTVYSPPYVSTPTTISAGINLPSALALDATGTLFVLNAGNGTVLAFAPPYTGAPTSIGVSYPSALLVGP